MRQNKTLILHSFLILFLVFPFLASSQTNHPHPQERKTISDSRKDSARHKKPDRANKTTPSKEQRYIPKPERRGKVPKPGKTFIPKPDKPHKPRYRPIWQSHIKAKLLELLRKRPTPGVKGREKVWVSLPSQAYFTCPAGPPQIEFQECYTTPEEQQRIISFLT